MMCGSSRMAFRGGCEVHGFISCGPFGDVPQYLGFKPPAIVCQEILLPLRGAAITSPLFTYTLVPWVLCVEIHLKKPTWACTNKRHLTTLGICGACAMVIKSYVRNDTPQQTLRRCSSCNPSPNCTSIIV